MDQVGTIQAKSAEKKVNESTLGRMSGLGEQASEVDMNRVRDLMKKNPAIGSPEQGEMVSKLMTNA